jgi:hypothetical protein
MPLKLFIYNNHKACESHHRLYFRILIFGLFFNYSYNLSAQNRFNYNYSFQSIENFASGIVPLDFGYLLLEQISDYDSIYTGIGIRKIDNSGNEEWVKILHDSGKLLFPGHKDFTQFVNSNLILISGAYEDTVFTPSRMQGILLRINKDGDSLSSTILGSQWQDFFTSSLLDIDNNIVSVGLYSVSSNSYNAWAIKTDTLGNVIWDKKFGGNNGDIFNSVIQAPDGGYYLAGASNSFNTYDDAFLVKVDVNGNLLWQKTFTTPLSDGVNGIVLSNNKLYLAGWQYTNYPISNKFDGMLLISDLDGNLITSKILGGSTLSNSFRTKTLALNDGSIVVAGESRTQQNPNVPWGWLYKFNQDGDSIWARTYFNNPNAPNYIYDLKATSDGGFIMAGSTHDSLGGIGAQNSWVLKVDEYGCVEENCQVYDAVENKVQSRVQMSASPNPFNMQTTINYILAENTKAELMVVEMATGKVIKRATVLSDASQTYTLSNEGLSPGVYAIQMFINAQLINAIKVVYIQ